MDLSNTAAMVFNIFDSFEKPISIHKLYVCLNGMFSELDILKAINEINNKYGNIIRIVIKPLSEDINESLYYYKVR